MKVLLTSILVVIVVFSCVVVGTTETSPKRIDVFDPSGDYHPTTRPADESEKSIQFVLQVRRNNRKLVAWGDVRSVNSSFKFKSVFVTEKHLKFATATVGSVSYDFDGSFLGRGNFASQSGGNGKVMLEGRLRKFVNGKKAMEISTSFVHYTGC